jgi:hypothetical protein
MIIYILRAVLILRKPDQAAQTIQNQILALNIPLQLDHVPVVNINLIVAATKMNNINLK